MIAVGAFSPLRGFIGQQDYHSIVESMRLANGLPWSIPVALQVARARSGQLTRRASQVALTDDHGAVLAIPTWKSATRQIVKRKPALSTARRKSPTGVAAMMQGGEVYLGGEIWSTQPP
jgi:ATP sulfurylase